jgi:hypothetical protein
MGRGAMCEEIRDSIRMEEGAMTDPGGQVDGIPSVQAVVGDSLSKPRAELRPEVFMSPMKVILGSISSSVTHGAACSEIEKRDALQ